MLKALLTGLLASVIASPTYTDNTVRVGMTKEQVEQLLGTPLLWGADTFGIGGRTFETWSYDGGLTVFIENGRVYEVAMPDPVKQQRKSNR